jgi:NADPH-dependent 2,4-dienoyl-CoA reductase/sulfur reductase-like enzyme
MRQTILVVGGLAAGPSAASKAKRVNPEAEVFLFEQGDSVSYGICEIPYYVGGTITDLESLTPFTANSLAQKKGVNIRTGHSVEEIFTTKKKILVRDLSRDKLVEYKYDKLILATGSAARALPVNGTDAKNVFRVKSLADGIAIKKFIVESKPGRAVIIGGGYVGMELCEALRNVGMDVVLLHLDSYPMTGLEEETRRAVLSELERNNVKFQPGEIVSGLVVDLRGMVTGVKSRSGIVETDLVIISIGVEPNSVLASQAHIRLGKHHGILTDERQSTSVDSIFAAGDCCEVKNIANNKWMYIPLATYAGRQGRVAGENAAGGRSVFKGAIRAIAVKVFDIEVAQVGLSFAEAEESGFKAMKLEVSANSKVASFPGNENIHVIGIADRKSGRLLGANVWGGQGAVLRADVLGVAISQRLTMKDLANFDLIYSPPFAPLWDPILVLANQMLKKYKPFPF